MGGTEQNSEIPKIDVVEVDSHTDAIDISDINLIGKTLTDIRSLSKEEAIEIGQDEWAGADMFVFDNLAIVCLRDGEGNGPGSSAIVQLYEKEN